MEMTKLKLARQMSGMSQAELAEIVGVQATTVMRWENGEYQVPWKKAVKVVGVLAEYGLKMKDLGYYV